MEEKQIPVHTWFFTFMCATIPVVGWFYLISIAFSKKKDLRREYARAFLLYKLVFLVVSLILLGILVYIGAGIMDQVLAYVEML